MNFKKRIYCFLLTMIMLVGMLPITSYAAATDSNSQSTPVFIDMPDNWAASALSNALKNGLLNGSNGKLMPDADLTRAQMAAMIVRAFGAKGMVYGGQFIDVKSSDWYADEIEAANQMGILQGDKGKVWPNKPITREEAFAVIARAFKFKPSDQSSIAFQDLNEISDWAKEEVYSLINSGYLHGSQNQLNPKGNISRAECAQIMDNLLRQYITISGAYSDEMINGNVMVNVPGVILQNLEIDGDLIVGDGVGDGELTLDSVNVAGRMVVRGGGNNSIIIKGNSNISTIIVSRIDGEVSVKIEGDSNVDIIYVEDGSNDVNIQGDADNLVINASDITVSVYGGEIGDIDIESDNLKLIIDDKSVVDAVNISKNVKNTEVEAEGKISNLTISGTGSHVSGTGTVRQVDVLGSAENARIETPNTVIIIDDGAAGITGGGGTELQAGTSAANNSAGNGIAADSHSGSSRRAVHSVGISGYAILGETLSAMDLEPAEASVLYQWQFSETEDGTYQDIPNATANLYMIGSDCVGGYMKLKIQGTGNFRGTVESAPTKLIKETDEAILADVFSEEDTVPEGGSGDSPADRIIWEITAENTEDQVTVDDISAGANGTVHLYPDSGFDSGEDEPIDLSYGLDNTVYIKVTSEYGSESRYYEVKIARRLPAGYIPVSNASELKQIEETALNTFGAGTLLEDQFTGGYDKKYMLIKDITLGTFEPIGFGSGYYASIFTGEFDGNGYILKDGTISYPMSDHLIGIFASNSGIIKNLGTENVTVQGGELIGGLVGRNNGQIVRCYSTGSVGGTLAAGGIVGQNYGTVTQCFATGDISANGYWGRAGGVAGTNQGGALVACYATGDVTAYYYAGGLIATNNGTVTQCYSTGKVRVTVDYDGGLVGANDGGTSYNQCYWNILTSTQTTSAGGEGRTTLQMKAGTPNVKLDEFGVPDESGDLLYENWDESIWDFGSEEEYPTFLWQAL